jgi:CRP-like cAMP-binding protein
VDVLKDDAATGAHVLISKLAPGGVFGEVSLLTGESRIATLAAAGPTTVSILGRDDFEWLVRVYPEVSLGLGKVLVERLAEATRIGIHVDPHVH